MGRYFAETLDNNTLDLDLKISPLTQKERLQGALKISSILLFLALGSVFLPVLHFFLVPGFLIASIVTFWFSFAIRRRFETENIRCPSCQKELALAHRNPQFPLRIPCDKCNNTFYIKETNE